VVTKLDRLARSLPDARAIAEELTRRQVRLSLGGSVYDPHDPVGRLLFNVLAMVAEFGSDLIRLRTKKGMRVARAKGRRRGKQPKLNPRQEAHLVDLYRGASTAAPSWPTCSASPAPPSTAHCNATGSAARRTITEQREHSRVSFAADDRRVVPQVRPCGTTRPRPHGRPPDTAGDSFTGTRAVRGSAINLHRPV
jgi:hypothetical protein